MYAIPFLPPVPPGASHVIYVFLRGPKSKVGCTKDLRRRLSYYRIQLSFTPVVRVLEVLFDATDEAAGDAEWQWADKLGYPRRTHYAESMRAWRAMPPDRLVERGRNWGRTSGAKGGRRCAELGRTAFQVRGICPHCYTETNLGHLRRYHGDRCRDRLVLPIGRPRR